MASCFQLVQASKAGVLHLMQGCEKDIGRGLQQWIINMLLTSLVLVT